MIPNKKTLLLLIAAVAGSSSALAQLRTDVALSDSAKLQERTFMGQKVEAIETTQTAPKNSWWSKVRASGSIQTDFLFPFNDEAINSKKTHDVLNNTYVDLTVTAPYISIGGRFEWAKWPLPGYEEDFDGWGVPYIWATGRYKWAELTAGDFYEQFGSGLILRTYEERSLGVDGAIRGGRLRLSPAPGLRLTALGGKQRHYWEHNPAWLWGGDAEWNISESFHNSFNPRTGLTVGFSYLGKHEPDQNIYTVDMENKLRLPRNTAAFDGRVKLRLRNVSILAEAATKTNDPTEDNNYTYRRGSAVLLSTTYAANGFSALVQAKRSDNMQYRSKRDVVGISSFINHLPAFTMTQTYALAAMYPYATNSAGEWAFQAELRYDFKRKTPLGGKYGTQLRLSGSYISGLDRNVPEGMNASQPQRGTDNFGAPFWKIGELYYADFNFELNKKISSNFKFTLFYLFQKYNQRVVEGHGVNGDMVTANTIIGEGQWKMSKKTQLRFEIQYLNTKQDLGDWIGGLVEFSFAPHWMISFSDTYNLGTTNLNYYEANVTYNLKANRFMLGFGRVRAGYNCSGGVCRYVPAYKGINLSYNYTF